MAKLSQIDTGPGKPSRINSIWSILRHGYDFHPNNIALMSLSQGPDHLAKLVGPAKVSPVAAPRASFNLFLRQAAAWLSCLITSLIFPSPSYDFCLSWSFAQLRRGAARIASVIDDEGVQPGSTLLLFLPTCAEWSLMMWVSALRCYTLVTLDPAIAQPGQERLLDYYIEKLKPSVVVVGTQASAVAVDKARSNLKSYGPFVGITVNGLEKPRQSWTSLPEISVREFTKELEATPAAVDSLDRVALIIFTSGTSSGKPKGSVWTVRDILRPVTGLPLPRPLRPPTTLINTKAAQSMAPCLLYKTWYSGNAGVLVGGNFNVATTIASMQTSRPIIVALYPHMVDSVCTHSDYSIDKVSSIRSLFIIGSVATEETLRLAQETFPRAKINASYGMTEAAGMFGWGENTPAINHIPSYKGIVSCGFVLPGVKIRIVDDMGGVVSQGSPGVLHICGDMVASGYIDSNGAELFYKDGDDTWYNTGDCAVLDEQRRVYILGRYEYMIRRDSTIIAPATVENAIKRHYPHTTICFTNLNMNWRRVLTLFLHRGLRHHRAGQQRREHLRYPPRPRHRPG
jgi:acyl-CoA synthetase (AMP-forming)/AMP-acid ligase II